MAKKLGLNIPIMIVDKFSASMSKVQTRFKDWGKSLEGIKSKVDFEKKKLGIPTLNKSFEDFGKTLQPLAVGLGVLGAAGVGAFALVKSSSDKLNDLDDLSKTIDMNVESIQELRYAADQMGSSAEEMDSGLRTFTEGMGKARAGSGKLLGFLDKINPAFKKQLMATKTNEEGFDLMLKSLSKVTDPQKKLALATIAFGTAGESIARVSGEGAEKLKLMREEARKFGLVTQDDIEHAADFDDGLKKLMFASDAAKNKIAVAMMPAFANLFSNITKWLQSNQDKVQKFANFLADGFPKAISFVMDAFESLSNSKLLAVIIKITDAVGALNIVFAGIGLYLTSVLVSTLLSVVSLFTALGFTASGLAATLMGGLVTAFTFIANAATAAWVAITGPIGLIVLGIAALVAAGVLIYKNWDSICEVFEKAWNWIKKITGSGLDKLKGIFGLGDSKIESNSTVTQVNDNKLGAQKIGAAELGNKYFEGVNKKSETDVNIKFDNLPKGTRVDSSANDSTNLNLGMGYAGVSPI